MVIIVTILFILLLLCFYFLVLLNMKMNRFKQNEQRQERLIEEMEASISSFLVDIEDENARLIEALKKQVSPSKQAPNNQVTEKRQVKEEVIIDVQEKYTKEPTFTLPKSYAKKAYGAQTSTQPVQEKKVQTIDERVKAMYMRGKSIDEIAKELNRGKTEVELMIKFQEKNK